MLAIIDKETKKVTTTTYVVSIPHNGCVIAKEVAKDFSDIPKAAVLCGFSDSDEKVQFTFRHKESTDHDGHDHG